MNEDKTPFLSLEELSHKLAQHVYHVIWMAPNDHEKPVKGQSVKVRESRIWSYLEGLSDAGGIPEGTHYNLSCLINNSGLLQIRAYDLELFDNLTVKIKTLIQNDKDIMRICFGDEE